MAATCNLKKKYHKNATTKILKLELTNDNMSKSQKNNSIDGNIKNRKLARTEMFKNGKI